MKIFLLFAALSFAAPEAPLRVQLAAEPNTLDPLHVSDVLGFNIISNVAEGLLRLDGEGKLRKGLAESYKISKDGLTYRFRLRKNAKWSDGKNVEIEELVFGFQHALDPKTAARDASLLSSIKEVKREGEEFVIRLKSPDSSLLQVLTMPLAAPLRKDVQANNGNWKAEGPSTGAYRIAVYKPDREIRLEPNPYYGGAKLPVLFRVVPEETTALNLFETGGLDILTTVPGTEITRLEKSLKTSDSASAFYLAFNLAKEPFSDPRWRKALAAVVQRESLAKVQPGTLLPATSYLPTAIEGALSIHADFAKEKAWAAARPKPKVSLVYPSTALANLILQRLQSDLKREGWDLKLEPMEWKAYLGRLQGEAPALFYMGYSAPFNDPMSHLKLFLSTEPDNRSRYKNAKYDALVEKVRRERGGPRVKAAEEAQKVLVEEDGAVIPLLTRPQLHAVTKGIKGFRINPYGVVDFREIRREN